MGVYSFMVMAEKKQKISVTGKQRFEYIYNFLSKEKFSFDTICDIGGTKATEMFFHKIYQNSKIDVYNMDRDELKKEDNFFYLDIEKDSLPQKYDLVFAGDIIEHLWEPFDSIKKMCDALNDGGLLIITTPNIANIYNRIFLGLGYALGNYHPTMRYRLGNPFLDKGDGIYSGSHKSLFNWRGIKELLKILNMEIIYTNGFSYYDFKSNINKKGNSFRVQYPQVRKIVNNLLPIQWREGMIIICKKGLSG